MSTHKMLSKDDVLKFFHQNKDYFVYHFGFKEIYLFGSYAKEKQNDNSDIDLLIYADKEKKTYKNLLSAEKYINENLHKNVDIVFIESLNPVVAETIKDGVIKIG